MNIWKHVAKRKYRYLSLLALFILIEIIVYFGRGSLPVVITTLAGARFMAYLLVVFVVVWFDTLSPDKKRGIEKLLHANAFLLFSLVIIICDLAYPVILTYDSGHYLWLADVLRANELNLWDPIRNVGVPLYLNVTQVLLGFNMMSALIPMIVNHLILYVFSCLVIFEVVNLSARHKTLVKFAVFLLIAMDPTIFGYYHVLLSEYLAASLAMVSCFMGIKLYKTKPFSRLFYLCLAYFLVMIPAAWQLKQPYLGTALFPFVVTASLVMIKQKSKQVSGALVGTLVLAIVLLGGLTLSWNSRLARAGNPMDPDRQFSNWLVRLLAPDPETESSTTGNFFSRIKENYLVASNFYDVERPELGVYFVIKKPSLTRSKENSLIAHHLYRLEVDYSNLFYTSQYQDEMAYLRANSNPPRWLDRSFETRQTLSNFLFIASYLLLPFVSLLLAVSYFRKPTSSKAALVILACLPLFNALIHAVFTYLDRYYFLGFPVLLCLWIIGATKLISLVVNHFSRKKSVKVDMLV